MIEEWKEVSENAGYEVSNLGRVRNKFTLKILRTGNNGNGYLNVFLYKDGKQKVFYVHRLVAKAFLANIDNKQEVNHIDGNKNNNVVTNLEWVTRSENSKHAYKLGLRKVSEEQRVNAKNQLLKINSNPTLRANALLKAAEVNKNKSKSEYIYNSRNQVKPIKCIELNKIFLSSSRVELKLGIKKRTIQKALHKGYESCGGYHWVRLHKHRFNNYGRATT